MNRTTNSFRASWPNSAEPAHRHVSGDSVGSSAKPPLRWLRRTGAVLGSIVGLLATVAVVGAAYEAIAAAGDATLYPPSGRLVDIGGYRLHLDCHGTGSPTVVMDAGLGGASLDWTLVQSKLATTTRVCSYDRAGMGWSDTGPAPRSPAHLAEELHTLLINAGVVGPYVLVGHSLAGKNIRMFAASHPEDVAGMVLVDSRSEQIDAALSGSDNDGFGAALKSQGTLYSLARRLGLARLFGANLVGEPLLSPAIATEMALLQTQPAAIAATTAEGLERSANDNDLASATLGAMPLVVIAAGASLTDIPGWPAAQRALAALSTNSRLVVAEASGHPVQIEAPDVVIEAVRDVLAQAASRP